MNQLNLQEYPSLFFEAEGGAKGRPLLLFLHGIGESGTDLEKVKAYGPPKLFPQYGLDRFSLVAPQCPEGRFWDGGLLSSFVEKAIEKVNADVRRIYVTGFSMGGFGAWDLAAEIPERFAAVAIVSGGGNPSHAAIFLSLPVWLFHSAADEAVKVENSDGLFEALRSQNAPVTYTRYRDAAHVATCEQAYTSSILYDWLLQHSSK
jgi:predicted peptidase